MVISDIVKKYRIPENSVGKGSQISGIVKILHTPKGVLAFPQCTHSFLFLHPQHFFRGVGGSPTQFFWHFSSFVVNINSEPKVKSFWEKSDHMERKIITVLIVATVVSITQGEEKLKRESYKFQICMVLMESLLKFNLK